MGLLGADCMVTDGELLYHYARFLAVNHRDTVCPAPPLVSGNIKVAAALAAALDLEVVANQYSSAGDAGPHGPATAPEGAMGRGLVAVEPALSLLDPALTAVGRAAGEAHGSQQRRERLVSRGHPLTTTTDTLDFGHHWPEVRAVGDVYLDHDRSPLWATPSSLWNLLLFICRGQSGEG